MSEQVIMTTKKRHGNIYDVFLGEMHLFSSSAHVAGPICASFNQYDTLKAKAELLKDLIDCIDNLIANKAHMPSVENLLKEAKELSK